MPFITFSARAGAQFFLERPGAQQSPTGRYVLQKKARGVDLAAKCFRRKACGFHPRGLLGDARALELCPLRRMVVVPLK
jgi:hypothetical protein